MCFTPHWIRGSGCRRRRTRLTNAMAREESPVRRMLSDFATDPGALLGLILLAVIVVAALGAPLISPQNPYDLAQLDIMDGRLPPGSKSGSGATFWLGTDDQGRDMLSAI